MKRINLVLFASIITLCISCADEKQDYTDLSTNDIIEDADTLDIKTDTHKCKNIIETKPIQVIDYKPFVKGPYLMYSDSTSVTIMWQTEDEESSVVDFGENQISFKRITTSNNKIHEVKIDNLKPDTLYYYRVGNGIYMTDLFTFRTNPVNHKPFRFAAYSDSQNHPERHTRLIPLIAEKGPAFIIHAGDAVEKGREEDRWQSELFDVIRPIAFYIPYYFAIGNHEANSEYYYRYFSYPYPEDNPQHESYYWFRYGAVFVIVIDSQKYLFGTEDPQHKWIINTLKRPESLWAGLRIAVFHQSAYTEGWGDCDYDGNLQIRNSLIPALEQGGINLILNGHTHGYERGFLNGVYHMIIGGGGGDLDRHCNDFPFIEMTNYVHHFIYADILCDKAIITAVDIDGNKFDEFEIPFKFPEPSR